MWRHLQGLHNTTLDTRRFLILILNPKIKIKSQNFLIQYNYTLENERKVKEKQDEFKLKI